MEWERTLFSTTTRKCRMTKWWWTDELLWPACFVWSTRRCTEPPKIWMVSWTQASHSFSMGRPWPYCDECAQSFECQKKWRFLQNFRGPGGLHEVVTPHLSQTRVRAGSQFVLHPPVQHSNQPLLFHQPGTGIGRWMEGGKWNAALVHGIKLALCQPEQSVCQSSGLCLKAIFRLLRPLVESNRLGGQVHPLLREVHFP